MIERFLGFARDGVLAADLRDTVGVIPSGARDLDGIAAPAPSA
jgi:hypothetical protein